jgi:hypothetical protein
MALRDQTLNILLWYSIFAWGTWLGGTLYQMLVVVPMWSASPPDSVRAFFQGTSYNKTIFDRHFRESSPTREHRRDPYFGPHELAEDEIRVRDILDGLADAKVVEDYPGFGKSPSVLVLQRDRDRNPIHVVWGIPKGAERPAVLVSTRPGTLE